MVGDLKLIRWFTISHKAPKCDSTCQLPAIYDSAERFFRDNNIWPNSVLFGPSFDKYQSFKPEIHFIIDVVRRITTSPPPPPVLNG